MLKRLLLLLISVSLLHIGSVAQGRYIDDVFSGVIRMDTVPFGQNITVLTMNNMNPDTVPLFMDVYMPEDDTVSNRPVVLLASTGNFLPRLFNGGPYGEIKDSMNVEFATRLARKGYVVCSYRYRKGWDPLNTDEEARTSTLLQAAYRGVQDTRTLARFLRLSVALQGNPFDIDPSKITVMGIGTGGYLALASAYLSDYSELDLPKFKEIATGNIYIDTTLHGNIFGTNSTPLNIPNHVGYSSDISLAVNLGGAVGDTSWIDAGEPPVICFHAVEDPYAPYDIGDVVVPTTDEVVIREAGGGLAITREAKKKGINDIFANAGFNDALTMRANSLNMNQPGLYPWALPDTGGTLNCGGGVVLPLVPQSGPYYWYDQATFIAQWDGGGFAMQPGAAPGAIVNCSELTNYPDMGPVKARAYTDTIFDYMIPRMALVLGLATSTDDLVLQSQVKVFPNPANQQLVIRNENPGNPIQEVALYDLSGREVYRATQRMASELTIDRKGWPAGMYLLRLRADRGVISKKIQFN